MALGDPPLSPDEVREFRKALQETGWWGDVSPGSAKAQFRDTTRRIARALARDLGWSPVKTHFNPSGSACSGTMYLSAPGWEIIIEDAGLGILIRTRDGRQIGRNHWLPWRGLNDWAQLVTSARSIVWGEERMAARRRARESGES